MCKIATAVHLYFFDIFVMKNMTDDGEILLDRASQFQLPGVKTFWRQTPGLIAASLVVDVKKRFFYVFNVILFSQRLLFKKNVGKVQSGKQINKKHFQNNSNEIGPCRIELQELTGI